MRLPRLFRRDRCAVCHLPARLGHHNATHDAHQATQDGSPVPVDGKPAPTPRNGGYVGGMPAPMVPPQKPDCVVYDPAACVVCATKGAPGYTSRQWQVHMAHTLSDEAARYQRDVDALEAHQRKVDAFAAALKEETA